MNNLLAIGIGNDFAIADNLAAGYTCDWIDAAGENVESGIHRLPPIPQRRLWGAPNTWPASWWDGLLDQLKEGVLEFAADLMGSAS